MDLLAQVRLNLSGLGASEHKIDNIGGIGNLTPSTIGSPSKDDSFQMAMQDQSDSDIGSDAGIFSAMTARGFGFFGDVEISENNVASESMDYLDMDLRAPDGKTIRALTAESKRIEEFEKQMVSNIKSLALQIDNKEESTLNFEQMIPDLEEFQKASINASRNSRMALDIANADSTDPNDIPSPRNQESSIDDPSSPELMTHHDMMTLEDYSSDSANAEEEILETPRKRVVQFQKDENISPDVSDSLRTPKRNRSVSWADAPDSFVDLKHHSQMTTLTDTGSESVISLRRHSQMQTLVDDDSDEEATRPLPTGAGKFTKGRKKNRGSEMDLRRH